VNKVNINYEKLPSCMKKLDRWVCFDIAPHPNKPDSTLKIPYIAGSDKKARSNDPETFSSYKEALACVNRGERDHLGFCFMKKDGMVALDIDYTSCPEEQGKNKLIFQTFPSYSERSVSGKGSHIFMRGELNGRGLHNSHLGVFDDCRFILVTGDIIEGRDKINSGNKEALLSLQEDVRTSEGKGYDFDLEETEWDAQPCWVNYICGCIYGKKFFNLIDGKWEGLGYPSQSEADHALVNMFCDVTESNELVRYLFAESGLYREWKARRDSESGEYSVKGYIDYSIRENRGKKLRAAEVRKRAVKNIEKRRREKKVARKKRSKKKAVSDNSFSDDEIFTVSSKESFNYPTDLIDAVPSKIVRCLARYLYKRSYRPNQQVSILSALVAIVKECQRAWLTPSGTACVLNLWVLGESGWGKEAFTKSLGWITSDLIEDHPQYGESHVGKFASGEAVETAISESKRVMSHVPEAGAYWRKLLNPHKPPHIDALCEATLNTFMAADPKSFWKTRRRAKKDEDTMTRVYRPAVSMYGESTIEDLFGDLDLSASKTGLLQRQIFFCLKEPDYVEPNNLNPDMPRKLRDSLVSLSEAADALDQKDDTIRARITKKAHHMISSYEKEKTNHGFGKAKDKLKAELMNRSAIKVYRMATVLAVGDDYENPVIKEKHASFAIKMIEHCDLSMVKRFKTGDIGKGQVKQERDMLKVIDQVVSASVRNRRRSYRMSEAASEDTSIVPYSLLKNKMKTRTSFSGDRLGTLTAIDRCIDNLCRAGTLVRLSKVDCEEDYDTAAGLLRYTGD